MMKTVLLLWYMENDNFGDTLISETVRDILNKNDFTVEDIEVGENPQIIIERANKCDFMLFAGGGIIERYLPPILARFSQYVDEILIPYGVIGISVGNFDYDYKSISLGKWVDKSIFFYSRDSRSMKILNRYSETNKVLCSGDCVFASNRICINEAGKKIGINIRDLPYEDINGRLEWDQIKKIRESINAHKLIMDSSNEICNLLLSNEDEQNYEEFKIKGKIEKADHIIQDISECRIIVAMRYHVVLVAALMGIPTIAIKYCPKVESVVEQLGIQDIAIKIGEYGNIRPKFNEVMLNYSEYQGIIRENVGKLRRCVFEMFEVVIEQMENSIG